MIGHAGRAIVLALAAMLVLAAPPARAVGVPWRDAELLRIESAEIQRRLFRVPDAAMRSDVAKRLARLRTLWKDRLEAVYRQASPDQAGHVDAAIDAFGEAAARWDAVSASAARARLWTTMIDGAFRATMTSLDAGRNADAATWLNIREYARTSRDTAAAIAMREALAGRLEPGEARRVIEAELLGIYAGELRRAIAEARSHLAADYGVQLAAARSRALGLHALLSENMTARLGAEPARAIAAKFVGLAAADTLKRSALDGLLADIERSLAIYAPSSLSTEQRDRRVRLLARFIGMVPIEYEKGVRDGEVTIPFEYFEAGLFRDRAEMLFGDLGSDLAERSPQSFDRLAELLADMKALIARKGDEAAMQGLADEARMLVASVYGTILAQGGYKAALAQLPDIFDEILLLAGAGDWEQAELKRLEAYSLFDPDIEQRLMPRAPSLAMRMEADFWEGNAGQPGLGRIIALRGPNEALKQAVRRMKGETVEAGAILRTRLSDLGAFLQSLTILLREGLEAVLVLACMIGTLKASGVPAAGVRGWRWPVTAGVATALAASCALWLIVGRLFAMSTLQREFLEGTTALIAASVLVYATHWIFRKAHVDDWIAGIRLKASSALQSGAGQGGIGFGGITFFSLAFLVVFREGFETVLFYEALLVDAQPFPVIAGLATGAALAAAIAYGILHLGARLPVAAFFRATGAMLMILCVMLAGSGIRGLQTAALMSSTPVSWFPDQAWLQVYLALYPVAEALLVQASVAGALSLSFLWPIVFRRRDNTRPEKRC